MTWLARARGAGARRLHPVPRHLCGINTAHEGRWTLEGVILCTPCLREVIA